MSKRGRQPAIKINKDLLLEVEKLSGQGLTQIQIANYYGVTPVTWHNTKKKYKNLDIAFKKGKSRTISEVSGRLMDKIRQGNLTAIIFYLKTQAGWSEKSTVELKDKLKSKKTEYKIDGMDAIEASKIYQSIMTGSYKDERNRSSE